MSEPVDECEIRAGDQWITIGISEALQRRGEDMRCPACHRRVDPHREYSDGARAHFEHRVAHSGCPTKPAAYIGKSSPHPDALS
jgi:hypothetical protein